MTISITHSAAEGTLMDGTRKGDGAIETLRGAGIHWKWFRTISRWGIPHSRDRVPDVHRINATAAALRAAGFAVEVTIDTTVRPMAESETDRASRMHERAEALAAKADRKGTAAEARWNAGQRIADGIPAGQPILVGHHSEPRHRRDLRRIDAHHHASAELAHEAELAAHGAQTAQQHMDHREAPGVTARRIERLQAERRRVQRGIDGHTRNFRNNAGEIYRREVTPPASGQALAHYTLQAAHLDEQIAYWTRLLAEHQVAGRWNPVNPSEIRKGDLVRAGRQWREVVRVNTKTVTVTTDYSWTDTLPLTDIREHRKATATVDLPAEAEEVAP